MRAFCPLFVSLLLISNLSFSQPEYEYFGAIKLNDSSLITYKIVVGENNGFVTGYSLTDLGGAHETKSYLSGYFDDKNNELEFAEKGIVYTKSPVTKYDFCFVNFKGKLRRLNERQEIKGDFKGLYADGKECIHGEIRLMSMFKMNKKTEKLDKRIDRNVLVKREHKDKINLKQSLDSLQMKFVNNKEQITVFTKGKNITLGLMDAGQEDGDRVSIFVNGKTILSNFEVQNEKYDINIPLEEARTVVRIKADNNGSIGGNTVMLDIRDTSGLLETSTNFSAGESAEFIFLKKR